MSEVKMSDVFDLPMVQGSIVLMSNDHRYVIKFDASDSNVGDQIEHVAHAVNNHDRLQQENAELREALQDLINCRGILTSDKDCVIKAKQLLNK